MDLLEYKAFPFVKEDLQENGIIKGYGSTFGGKPDSYNDVIAEGAFLASLAKNGRGGMGFPMLWMHDSSDPAGVWERLSENKKGLAVEGPIERDSEEGKRKYNLAKMGAVKGLSIGFDLDRDKTGKIDPKVYDFDEKSGIRLLKKINLWEISLVTFAANSRARITGVKSLQEAKSVRDFEKALRELGLTQSQSIYIASLCRPGLRDSGKGEIGVLETLNDTLLDAAKVISPNKGAIEQILDTLSFVNNKMINEN